MCFGAGIDEAIVPVFQGGDHESKYILDTVCQGDVFHFDANYLLDGRKS